MAVSEQGQEIHDDVKLFCAQQTGQWLNHKLAEQRTRMVRLLILISLAVVNAGCKSVSSRPFYTQVVPLSALNQITVVYDASRYSGINLIITNDLPSDVFLKFEPQEAFLPHPQETQTSFRLPDMDERYRVFRGTGMHPFMSADVFMYVWSGNKGFYHIFQPDLLPGRDYYLPITYYMCKEAGFYTQSLKIKAANKSGAANRSRPVGTETNRTPGTADPGG